MSIKIQKYLKLAKFDDLFSSEENIIENQALFYKSQLDGNMYGAYFTNSNTDLYELYIKFTIGMVFVLNFDTPGNNDLPIELKLHPATAFDIKEGPKDLQYGKPYYIKEGLSVEGPFFLSQKSDPYDIKQLLDNNKMYVISTNQNVEILTNQKVVV